MAKKNKRNWDKIRTQPTGETARYRDVYEEQQLDRSYIEKPRSMTSRLILTGAAALLVAAVLWLIVAGVETTGALDGVNAGWKKTFFSKDGAKSPYQYVTLREAIPVEGEEGEEQAVRYETTRYIWYQDTGVLTDIQNGSWPRYTGCAPLRTDENGNLTRDPEPIGYGEDGEPIYDEEYIAAQAAREAAAAEMETKPKILLVIDTDGAPIGEHPDCLGKLDKYGYVFPSNAAKAYIDYDGNPGSGDEAELPEGFDPYDEAEISQYGFELGGNAYRYVRLNRGKPEDTSESLFHENFMDMRPTPLKLLLGLLGFAVTFGLMYAVMKKNLAAENILTDTADVNQHHNDQHVALPEEVQMLYDIFPDVGAHSSVMVSSMISHQMITNKGLKKVQLAKRAEKDILDEDGDVEVYKGDILRDEHGEPITVEVPLIDTKFSEGLFDSAKVPQDKKVRKYYDTGDISYNPGDANLDKLKGYNTVQELINGDWTFPVYEPQRPGGVYIVDTAPVNTMV